MDPFFHTGLSISDSLKTVRKSVLIYETIIDMRDSLKNTKFVEMYGTRRVIYASIPQILW